MLPILTIVACMGGAFYFGGLYGVAIGKGFAIGSAALAALALFSAYRHTAQTRAH